MLKRVTMREIAERAGVHSTTISLALRNHPSLPEATRQRLQDLAREMGYRPDPMLGALMHYRSMRHPSSSPPLIIYLNPWRDRESWGTEKGIAHYQLYLGAKERADASGFLFEHCWLHGAGISTRRWNQIIQTRNVRGIILGSLPDGRSHLRLELAGRSWVKLDNYYASPRIHLVANNQVQCSQLAVRQTRKYGYRRIGLVMSQGADEMTNRGWTAGYLAETANYPKSDQIPRCIFADLNENLFWKWFDRYRPQAILGYAHILKWLLKKVRVPEDVGFADLYLVQPDGRKAGIFQNSKLVGSIAVDVLANLIQHNEVGPPRWPLITHVNGVWMDGATLPARYSTPKEK